MLRFYGLAYAFCYRLLYESVPNIHLVTISQIATSDIRKFAFVVEGAEVVARSIPQFAIFKELYLLRVYLPTKPKFS